jgi:hypothetical protein
VSETRPKWKKWLLPAVKLAILTLIVAFLGATLHREWKGINEYPWTPRFEWFLPAALLYLVTLLPEGLLWYRVMTGLGQQPGFYATMRAYYIGHLGKYVPGKAMVPLIRVGMIRGPRVDTAISVAGVFIGTLNNVAVGGLVSAGCMAVYFWNDPTGRIYVILALAIMLVAGLPILPPVFVRLARFFIRLAAWTKMGKFFPRMVEKLQDVQEDLQGLGNGPIVRSWGPMVIGWVLLGLSYWATLRGMGIEVPLDQLPRLTGATSLAMVAGFMAFVIPAGVGVREFAMTLLMRAYFLDAMGPDITRLAEMMDKSPLQVATTMAVTSAVVLRIVQVVAETAFSGILYGVRPRGVDRPPETSSPDTHLPPAR